MSVQRKIAFMNGCCCLLCDTFYILGQPKNKWNICKTFWREHIPFDSLIFKQYNLVGKQSIYFIYEISTTSKTKIYSNQFKMYANVFKNIQQFYARNVNVHFSLFWHVIVLISVRKVGHNSSISPHFTHKLFVINTTERTHFQPHEINY